MASAVGDRQGGQDVPATESATPPPLRSVRIDRRGTGPEHQRDAGVDVQRGVDAEGDPLADRHARPAPPPRRTGAKAMPASVPPAVVGRRPVRLTPDVEPGQVERLGDAQQQLQHRVGVGLGHVVAGQRGLGPARQRARLATVAARPLTIVPSAPTTIGRVGGRRGPTGTPRSAGPSRRRTPAAPDPSARCGGRG